MIEAVIFDNDGVLVDSEPLHHLAETQTLAQFNIDFTEEDFKKYVGIGWHKMLSDWIVTYNLPTTTEKLREIHERNLINAFEKYVEQTPNVEKFIIALKNKNYKLGVASSSSRVLVETGLRKTRLLHYFDLVVCSDNVKNTKPDPEIYLLTADRLGISPEKCFVIEDSSTGVKAAKAAGMQCGGYQNPNSGNQDLSRADVIFKDFFELQNLL